MFRPENVAGYKITRNIAVFKITYRDMTQLINRKITEFRKQHGGESNELKVHFSYSPDKGD